MTGFVFILNLCLEKVDFIGNKMLQLHFNCIIETYLIFVMLLNGFIHPFLIPKGKCCRVKSKGLEIKLSWIQILALLFTTDCT